MLHGGHLGTKGGYEVSVSLLSLPYSERRLRRLRLLALLRRMVGGREASQLAGARRGEGPDVPHLPASKAWHDSPTRVYRRAIDAASLLRVPDSFRAKFSL